METFLPILARHYGKPNPYDEWLKENLGLVVFIGVVILVVWGLYKFIQGTYCEWCQKKIPIFSPHKKTIKGMHFCSTQCSMKFLNEAADIADRIEGIGKSNNININDRNKYL
jgi:hypothetical protein